MNFDQYADGQHELYTAFAKTVAEILNCTIGKYGHLRLQQIQSRGKDPASLKVKLEKSGKLESEAIEDEIKDLAGCRVIFYTNSDVSAFISSDILRDNFKIDWLSTKFHHPVPLATQDHELFISNNFVIALNGARAALPEYEQFRGLRCEVQVQTILNHAWSEMSHDTIYKKPPLEGFGGRLMSGIEERMKKIMREYLIPAGYEFQKIANDFERLSSGKELFDEGPIKAIVICEDNNELHEKLRQLREHVLPLYDDVRSVHIDIRNAIVTAVRTCLSRERKPIETPFGLLDGFTVDQILDEAAGILDELRYIDESAVLSTFDVICLLFDLATSDKQRKRLEESAKRLAGHSLDIWNHSGPVVQHLLVQRIHELNLDTLGPSITVVLETLGQVLRAEVRGTSSTYNTLTIKSGAVVPSSLLLDVRSIAINILQEIFLAAKSDHEKRIVIQKLSEANRTPHMNNYPNSLVVMTLNDSATIVEFFTKVSTSQSYILLEEIEHDCLWLYRRNRSLLPSMAGDTEIAIAQDRLIKAVKAYRERVNADQKFVIFKTLVGFQSVFPPAWEDDDFDIEKIDVYRKLELDRLVREVNEACEDIWFGIICQCANTSNNDLATFPSFSSFLEQLGSSKPGIALRYIDRMDDALANFLPAMLCGLEKSDLWKDTSGKIRSWIDKGKYIRQIIDYCGRSTKFEFKTLEKAIREAIKIDDELAVLFGIQVSVKRFCDASERIIEDAFLPALRFLASRGNHDWVNAVWFVSRAGRLFHNLTATQQDEILASIVSYPEVDFRVEEILKAIAESAPQKVIEFFEFRLKFDDENRSSLRYSAIPFEFSQCDSVLQKVPNKVIGKVRSWFEIDKSLFTYRGGRFIKVVFPEPTDDVLVELQKFVAAGTLENIDFVIRVLTSYDGHVGTHQLLKEIIDVIPPESPLLSEIASTLDAEGVVSGEFGYVETYLRKKGEIESWLTDPREKVRKFAKHHIISLDRLIADEQRRVEQNIAMRKRAYGEE